MRGLALSITIFIGMPEIWQWTQAFGCKRLMGERLVMIPLLTPLLAFWLSLLGLR
ncbi:TPA: hypothetical protein R4D26_001003 [Salmonella enterica subsp. enterica serovar Stanley]|nr:hypothetical protein [Salmonella enterica subsp. enterica serovar Stanley]